MGNNADINESPGVFQKHEKVWIGVTETQAQKNTLTHFLEQLIPH